MGDQVRVRRAVAPLQIDSADVAIWSDHVPLGDFDEPFTITQSTVLARDYNFRDAGITIDADDVVLDLNGYTLWYNNVSGNVLNYSFEDAGGEPTDIVSWDTTGAPNAIRKSTDSRPMHANWCIYFPLEVTDQWIISSWVDLPANVQAIATVMRDKDARVARHMVHMKVEHDALGIVAEMRDIAEYWVWFNTPATLGQWRVHFGFIYTPTPTWQPDTAYNVGDIVVPSTPNGKFYICKQAGAVTNGTTGATEPTWNKTIGATTADNNITWTCTVRGFKIGESGASSWEPNTQYDLDQDRMPTVDDGTAFRLTNIANPGGATSGSSEPTWAVGNLDTPDGDLVWSGVYEFKDALFDYINLTTVDVNGVEIASYRDNATITGGTIKEIGAGYQCMGINHTGGDTHTVSNMTIETNGVRSSCVFIAYSTGSTVTQCTMTNHSEVTFNRVYIGAAVNMPNSVGMEVSYNTITCTGEGWGCILVGGPQTGCANGLVEWNNVSTKSMCTNHYAIMGYKAGNTQIRHNTIVCDPGQAIKCENNAEAYCSAGAGAGPVIEYNDITINSTGPYYEEGWYTVDAIRVNDYFGEYAHSTTIRYNTIELHGTQAARHRGYDDIVVAGIMFIGTGSNNIVHNNTITCYHKEDDIVVVGICAAAIAANQLIIRDNTIESDDYNIAVGDYAGYCHNCLLDGNELIKPATASAFYSTYAWIRPSGTLSQNMLFRDTVLTGGADLDTRVARVWWNKHFNQTWPTLVAEYDVEWTITIDGPPNVSVVAYDIDDTEVWNTTTDGSGYAATPLKEYLYRDHAQDVRTPHRVIVNGVEKAVTVDAAKTVEYP